MFIQRLVLISMLLITGCMSDHSPDHWSSLSDDFDKAYQTHQDRPVAVDENLTPRMEQISDIPKIVEGQPLTLSIEHASYLMLNNNTDFRTQQLNPVLSGAYEQIERGVFDPELYAEAQLARERSLETARSTGTQFNVDARRAEIIAGLRQQFPTGTVVDANVSQDRSISNRAPEQQQARLGLTVTQSLLRGFGPAVNMVRIKQSQLDTLASRYELRGYAEALLAETEIAYWLYVLADREIKIYENSLELAIQQRDEIQQRISVGLLPEIEAAAALAEVARREQELIDARSQLQSRRLQLLRLINPRQNGNLNIQLTLTTQPDIKPEVINDPDQRIQLADRYRPDLNEARLRLRQDRMETMVTRNGLLPRLELFIALGKTGYDNRFDGSVRDIRQDTYDITAGVRFSQYLGNRSANARDRIARMSRQQSAAAIDNLKQLIHHEIQLALNEVERTRQQIAASAVTREYQTQTLAAEQERFNVGSSTSLLVSSAQRDLLAAKISEVESVIQYRIALVNLYLAEGSLLERRGITLANTR